MKLLTSILACLLCTIPAFAEDGPVVNCWDNEEPGEGVAMCLDETGDVYKGEIIFIRICKSQPQYGRIAVRGKGDQKNLDLSTKSGSKFAITYGKDADGMDFIKINPDFSPNEKILWEKSDSCGTETTSVPGQFESYLQNTNINMLQHGLD